MKAERQAEVGQLIADAIARAVYGDRDKKKGAVVSGAPDERTQANENYTRN